MMDRGDAKQLTLGGGCCATPDDGYRYYNTE
jgi:hypothetical protein